MEWVSSWWLWIGVLMLFFWIHTRRHRGHAGRGLFNDHGDHRASAGQAGRAARGGGGCCGGHASHGGATREAGSPDRVTSQHEASHAAHPH